MYDSKSILNVRKMSVNIVTDQIKIKITSQDFFHFYFLRRMKCSFILHDLQHILTQQEGLLFPKLLCSQNQGS